MKVAVALAVPAIVWGLLVPQQPLSALLSAASTIALLAHWGFIKWNR